MSRSSLILAALTAEPTSTSDVYDRVGYPALVRVGLVGYEAFRAELVKLAGEGLVVGEAGEDGATTWRRTDDGAPSTAV